MKKWLSCALIAALLSVLFACGKPPETEKKPVRVLRNSAGMERSTTFEYDRQGNVTRTEELVGDRPSITLYENTYNAQGLLAQVLMYSIGDGSGGKARLLRSMRSYAYDAQGRCVQSDTHDEEGSFKLENYDYDAKGQISKVRRREGGVVDGSIPFASVSYTNNTYDEEGRLTLSETYGKDEVFSNQTTYIYDDQGRKTQEDTESDGVIGRTTYEYNEEGLLARMDYYTDVGTPHEWQEGYDIFEY